MTRAASVFSVVAFPSTLVIPNGDGSLACSPGESCVIAGGVMVNESFVCSTYWHPDPADPFKNGGVSNITEKIVGDDGAFIVQQ